MLDNRTSFISASHSGVSVNANTVEWNFTNLSYNSGSFLPSVSINVDTSAQIGDTLCFKAIVTPLSTDEDSTNNVKTICLPAIQSYDPNDKRVFPEGECEEKYLLKDTTISYAIRFQNVGNTEAINVFITDTLHPALDIETVEITGYSHPMYTEIVNNNVLKFHFDDIYLPDSTSNEPESHGLVFFDVKAKSNVTDNTPISNGVQIFFDFNEPVYTNLVENVLVDEWPPCVYTGDEEHVTRLNDFIIYPNPVSDVLSINGLKESIDHIQVLDVAGKVLINDPGDFYRIQTGSLHPGMYFLLIESNGIRSTMKFIKQ